MSVHVMSWVLRHSEATLADRLVLLVLADHAREDGTAAWPSVDTIAQEARISERQARRCLRSLEDSGVIRETGRSKQGTHVYEFPLYRKGGDNMTPPGGTNRAEGGDRMTPEPSLKQPSIVLTPAAKNGKAPNPVWDALSELFGEPSTRTAQTGRGKVVSSLTAAGATPDEIFKRAKRWALHFDHATLTDHALEKHWDTLPLKPRRIPR